MQFRLHVINFIVL